MDTGARRQLFLLGAATTLAGFVEMLGIGLVIPFMITASNSQAFGFSNRLNLWLNWLMNTLGIPHEWTTPALGLILAAVICLANAGICAYQLFSTYFVAKQKAIISQKVLHIISSQPISYFDENNSAELSKSVLSDVGAYITCLSSTVQLVAVAIRVAVLYLFFLLANANMAVGFAAAMTCLYLFIHHFIHHPLVEAGKRGLQAASDMYKTSNEVLNAFRDIQVSGTTPYFLQRFEMATNASIHPEYVRGKPGYITRAILETATVASVVGMLVYFHHRDGNLGNGLPLMSAYVIAGIRLIPALQQALSHWVQIRYLMPTLWIIKEFLDRDQNASLRYLDQPVPFQQTLEMDKVSYSYALARERPVLNEVSLTIERHTRVAFVGSTGAGKTTATDILLGLREPTSGRLVVDGQPITAALSRSWRKNIGYVPQDIYLLDSTVVANVAFGIPEVEIDRQMVEQACKVACIHDFIVNELPDGYQSSIGERGTRLSGGQCQRLGIARALYHNPDIIIFDEATSSLDNVTENSILQALDALKGVKTLIVVAHRLHTVWSFDKLFVLERGHLVGAGRAEDLLESCQAFRELATVHPDPTPPVTLVT